MHYLAHTVEEWRFYYERIESAGFRGHYTNAFGSLADMLAARETLVAHAQRAGVAVD